MCTLRHNLLSLMLFMFVTNVNAMEENCSEFLPNSVLNRSLTEGYVYKTPENKTPVSINRIAKKFSTTIDTNEIVHNFPYSNLFYEFERCGNQKKPYLFTKHFRNNSSPIHSAYFLEQLPLKNRLSIKMGGSHLLKQINNSNVTSECIEFPIILKFHEKNIVDNYLYSKENQGAKCLEAKMPFASISSKSRTVSIDRKNLSKSFSVNKSTSLRVNYNKRRNLQLSYIGQQQNTTIYIKSKDAEELFYNLLKKTELENFEWSISSDGNI